MLQGLGNEHEAQLHYHLVVRHDPETETDLRYLETMTTTTSRSIHSTRSLDPPRADLFDGRAKSLGQLGIALADDRKEVLGPA